MDIDTFRRSTPAFWLACWQALLDRLSGGTRFVTGVLAGARRYEELQDVVGPLDQKSLNADVAEFQAKVPTTENLAIEIYRRLTQAWRSVFPGEWPVLERVRIVETARNIFEIGEAHGQK